MVNSKSDARIVHIGGAAQHAAMLQGLTVAIRLSIGNPDKRTGDEDSLIELLDLLQELLPDEDDLRK
jgi:hypothetical protein